MPAADFFTPLGLLSRKNFFDAGLCASLRAEVQSARRIVAAVREDGRTYVEPGTRSTQLAKASASTVSLVESRLLSLQPEVERHFRLSLAGCRPPQFLAYQPGDFFAAHRDTGVEPGAVAKPNQRQVSIVIFLNGESAEPRESCYSGGRLTFFGLLADPRAQTAGLPLLGEEGLLVAFRSSILHEVSPVTRGERYTIVSWF